MILPESAIEFAVRCAEASPAALTRRLETVILSEIVMLFEACKVSAPAFQLVLLSASAEPPSVVASRNKSAEITISSGSISTAPSVPS